MILKREDLKNTIMNCLNDTEVAGQSGAVNASLDVMYPILERLQDHLAYAKHDMLTNRLIKQAEYEDGTFRAQTDHR